mmetsp:Transcript_13042/g.36695  ORF Transcript_13042/g.36695 Transcript_13042/m.36695 type:complete len:215 (+) Transcript_13042:654-1298(+)
MKRDILPMGVAKKPAIWRLRTGQLRRISVQSVFRRLEIPYSVSIDLAPPFTLSKACLVLPLTSNFKSTSLTERLRSSISCSDVSFAFLLAPETFSLILCSWSRSTAFWRAASTDLENMSLRLLPEEDEAWRCLTCWRKRRRGARPGCTLSSGCQPKGREAIDGWWGSGNAVAERWLQLEAWLSREIPMVPCPAGLLACLPNTLAEREKRCGLEL